MVSDNPAVVVVERLAWILHIRRLGRLPPDLAESLTASDASEEMASSASLGATLYVTMHLELSSLQLASALDDGCGLAYYRRHLWSAVQEFLADHENHADCAIPTFLSLLLFARLLLRRRRSNAPFLSRDTNSCCASLFVFVLSTLSETNQTNETTQQKHEHSCAGTERCKTSTETHARQHRRHVSFCVNAKTITRRPPKKCCSQLPRQAKKLRRFAMLP